jgi:hypothetical protein
VFDNKLLLKYYVLNSLLHPKMYNMYRKMSKKMDEKIKELFLIIDENEEINNLIKNYRKAKVVYDNSLSQLEGKTTGLLSDSSDEFILKTE